MERPRHLFREWGLTLALLLVAVLLWWRTMVPALQKNRELDRRQTELREEQQREQEELERLRASEAAAGDPIEVERVQRRQHGELGLPSGERGE